MEWLSLIVKEIMENELSGTAFLPALFSIIVNVVISVAGVLPSVFLTAINISYFGFETGLLISIIGEALGAIITFILYRKGISLAKLDNISENRYFMKLKQAEGKEWIFLLFLFRIMPFVPSGVVTAAAAFSSISTLAFAVISTIGKIPALVIEALIVVNVIQSSNGTWIMLGAAIVLVLGYGAVRLIRSNRG
ncbi:VTT domain-containing protein [Rossellomorea aquimaris]|uniref:TVP38/TMEM64 family protein n=1 Tax=Rossellomorea aquimaris TaxID=189382 RepID=UPI001CD7C3F5|nr:VTT domain-containing protein [Rossellomorea aquimaris]MCA1055342.1 VTT domain-containing protein [Rossellomorea aquimaris]